MTDGKPQPSQTEISLLFGNVLCVDCIPLRSVGKECVRQKIGVFGYGEFEKCSHVAQNILPSGVW
uniref:Uncharacterized protein n=1 Tax=Romanomermis culicivorax TaxID=13658 RepID=A0A915KX66_ROMCU